MDSYRVLIIDNEDDIRSQAEKQLRRISGVQVVTAKDLSSARAVIEKEFFHAAFVDLQLMERPGSFPQGMLLLADLRDKRPSCRRFLLTEWLVEYRTQIAELLVPNRRLVEGIVDKTVLRVSLRGVVKALAREWLASPVEVEARADLAMSVRSKCRRGEHGDGIPTTDEEVDYLISSLLGQGRQAEPGIAVSSHRAEDGDRICQIALRLQTKGRSRSVVGAGRPSTAGGHAGTYCVVKISRLAEALEERNRYEQYMRFGSASDRRVELLGAAFGDTIGALCYAFAGRSPEHVTDLESLTDAHDGQTFKVLESLFGPDSQWAENQDEEEADLGGFFADAYDLDADSVIQEVTRFASKNASKWGTTLQEGVLRLRDSGSQPILLPTQNDVALTPLRSDYTSSIVHGDMNAANVMVAKDGRVMLIDFRHTCRGPRYIDFAALQTSLRLSQDLTTSDSDGVLGTHAWERRLMSGMATGRVPHGLDDSAPFWVRVSWRLIETSSTDDAPCAVSEYAATCLLYALRILRIAQIDDMRRLRLLVWVSALLEVLRKPNHLAKA